MGWNRAPKGLDGGALFFLSADASTTTDFAGTGALEATGAAGALFAGAGPPLERAAAASAFDFSIFSSARRAFSRSISAAASSRARRAATCAASLSAAALA